MLSSICYLTFGPFDNLKFSYINIFSGLMKSELTVFGCTGVNCFCLLSPSSFAVPLSAGSASNPAELYRLLICIYTNLLEQKKGTFLINYCVQGCWNEM